MEIPNLPTKPSKPIEVLYPSELFWLVGNVNFSQSFVLDKSLKIKNIEIIPPIVEIAKAHEAEL